ncbi:SlyX family protein [Bartonella senegalensis]|uniref:SlyX family protein n=1 Tax=Bartonella senegalensis TaxID=1468418 RepID=UPI0002E48AC2|nr:SlyX family protein [Bartonella senegalensis]
MSDENRLTALEIKLAHQEKLLEQLSCVVIDQRKSLEKISKKVNILTRRFPDLEEQIFSKNIVALFFHE